MTWPLRQSTASQEIPLGPFVDSVDGNSAETGLTIANTDIKLQKNGATSQTNKNSGGATHIATGDYYAVLDATDTDTVGPMRVKVHVAGALPVWLDCMVFEEVVYDALYAASAPGFSTVAALATAQTSIDDLPTNAELATALGTADDAVLAAIADKTGYALTSGERNAIADALLERNVAGGSSAGRKVLEALAFLRNKWVIIGTTLTVYDTDDSTELWTAELTPTAGADPVTGSDPA